MVEDYPQLAKWLHDNRGKQLWSVGDKHRRVEAWQVNGHVALIVLYANRHGWRVYTETDSIYIPDILADVAKRLGLK